MLIRSSLLALAMLATAPALAQTHQNAVRDVQPVRLCSEQTSAHPAVSTDRSRCVLPHVRSPVAQVRAQVIAAAPSDGELLCRVSGDCERRADGVIRS
jgi:hypothetical protein